ncbi:caspase family protein [Okeanomitos corallinicola TIOX110]|uniref:Caspase family protein n=1 Tax=Okeanomitos corallinicola TIOX110 TaxID=3133117 RepID=A0ABZ2UZB2_9CYAN
MKRRAFLERIGSILALLGLTQAEWLTLGNRYHQALATPNSRKLALLVGINEYPQSSGLSGCLTDVELQTELLINRFGFANSDILTLTDEQASREFIEAAILDHLGKQAKADDVVIFHFSGYGTRVKTGNLPETVENALIPVDKDTYNGIVVNYLLEETLLQLLRSLPTAKVAAVLDTSYNVRTTPQPSGLRFRSRPESLTAKLTVKELEFLNNLQTENTAINNSNLMVLKATSNPEQPAGEMLFSGFTAGLFTYALTQYLWETTPATTIQVLFSHVSSSMYKLGGEQQPGLLTEKKNPQSSLVTDIFPLERSHAQAVIRAKDEESKTAQLWLGGLPPHVCQYYGVGSRLTTLSGEQLIVKSRTGLRAKAQILNQNPNQPLQIGQLVQENVRVLPRNINLTVALGGGLERIERVDATSAFAAITRKVNIAAPEQGADYIFGKLQSTPSRYSIFSIGGEPILNTAGEVGEAVKVAVQRLTPKFSTLLAAKLWRLTENEGSSRLAVKASLEIVNKISSRLVMQRQTKGSVSGETIANKVIATPGTSVPTVPVGSRMQYRVENLSDRPIYLMLVGLNNNRSAVAFYPWQIPSEEDNPNSKPRLEEVVITPGQTLKFPENDNTFGWLLSTRAFFAEHQLIISAAPFTQTLTALRSVKYPTADQQPISPLVNDLEVAQALLQDLHNASKVKVDTNGTTNESYVLDVNNWASLNFSFQVV